MALKPGQVNAIKVQLGKIDGLRELKKKLSQMINAQDNVKYGHSKEFSDKLQKQLKAVSDQIKLEIADVKKKIEAAKKPKPNQKISAADAKIIKMVATDCSNYLAAFKNTNTVLLRGISSHSDKTAFVGRSWENREPKDSSASAQKAYDAGLSELGIKALRKNSIFTTASYSHASNFGRVYIIIPKNTANFSWSQVYRDIVLHSDSFIDTKKVKAFVSSFKAFLVKNKVKLPKYYYEGPLGKLDSALSDGNIPNATKIMKKYNFPIPKDFSKNTFSPPDTILKKYKPTDQNFELALKKKHEVMISGEYYAFTLSNGGVFAQTLLDSLGIKPTNVKWKNKDYDDDEEEEW